MVEGPNSWYRVGDMTGYGEDFHKVFALGHQYHAFLLYFDELVDSVEASRIRFNGADRSALTGTYPYGGTVHMVTGDAPGRPAGMRFEFANSAPIDVIFRDWLDEAGEALPFLVVIDDGERTFEYRYDEVRIEQRSPFWFFEATGEAVLDEIGIYRLHRSLLAAHCLGDADLMAELSAGEVVSANRGSLSTIPQPAVAERFAGLFERLDYREYHDLRTPVIAVSEAGDIGWIAVQVRAVGIDRGSDTAFDSQWAWLMAVRKIDGQWRHAGNASSPASE